MLTLARSLIRLTLLWIGTIQSFIPAPAQTTLFKNFIICDGTGNKMYTGDVRMIFITDVFVT